MIQKCIHMAITKITLINIIRKGKRSLPPRPPHKTGCTDEVTLFPSADPLVTASSRFRSVNWASTARSRAATKVSSGRPHDWFLLLADEGGRFSRFSTEPSVPARDRSPCCMWKACARRGNFRSVRPFKPTLFSASLQTARLAFVTFKKTKLQRRVTK